MVGQPASFAQEVALRIPTRDQIRDVAMTIPTVPASYLKYQDGPRTWLTVSAGAVRISCNSEQVASRARFREQGLHVDASLVAREREAKSVAASELAWLNGPMALVDMPGEAAERLRALDAEVIDFPTRGLVTAWSRRSKSRMELVLRSLDYMPLFDAGDIPAMVTLTMPGKFWELCTPNARAFKNKVSIFRTYYKNAWGSAPVGVWKMEFQRRGAPHLHILTTPPRGLSAGREKLPFSEWLSVTWSKIVFSGIERVELPEVVNREAFLAMLPQARANHIAAGTGVDYVEGQRYMDPKRMAQYFAKHGAYSSKDYQNQMPRLWLDAIENGAGGANFWGYWGLLKTDYRVELDQVTPANTDTRHYVK